jgi:hypothetical protein
MVHIYQNAFLDFNGSAIGLISKTNTISNRSTPKLGITSDIEPKSDSDRRAALYRCGR